MRRGIGIDVGHHVHAGGARGIDHRERHNALAPHLLANCLVMCEHDWNVCAPADLYCFRDSFEKSKPFLAQVRGIDAAGIGCCLRECDNLLDVRVRTGNVEESSADPEGAVAHPLCDHVLHLGELGCGRRAIRFAHDGAADRVVPHQIGDVDADRLLLARQHVCRERPWGAAVRTTECQRDALRDGALCTGQFGERLEVGMKVDEAGCDNTTLRVDHASRVSARNRGTRNERDAVAGDGDVGAISRSTGSVDDCAASDQDVELLGLGARAGSE